MINNILNFSKPYVNKIAVILISFLLLFSTFGLMSTYTSIKQAPATIINWAFPPSQSVAEIENIVIGGFQEMDVLTTAQISNRATIKASENRMLSRFQIGQTNLIYEGVGNVEAGINLENLKIELDKKDNKIHIKLPSAHLQKVYLDIKKSGIIDTYKKGLGANIEQRLQDEAQRKALIAIEKEACSINIIKQANKKAQELVEKWTSPYDNIIVEAALSSEQNCHLQS